MGLLSIIIVLIWVSLIFNGVYGVVKGYFYGEKDKAAKHEPQAYRKWVKLSSGLIIICGVLNTLWSILDGFSEANDFKYTALIIATVVVVIAIVAVAYTRIVKPADKANGIEHDEMPIDHRL